MTTSTNILFFGTSDVAVDSLEELHHAGLTPKLIITQPDKPKGRGQVLAATPVKEWAIAHHVPTMEPEKLAGFVIAELKKESWDVGIVVAYGLFLPTELVHLPHRGVLNMHPSLLPRLRGPSPIQSAILLDEKQIGVTVMQIDEEMDHGPIVAQKEVVPSEWPARESVLRTRLSLEGAKLLAEVLPHWLEREVAAVPQDHLRATFTRMFRKEDGYVDLLNDGPGAILRTIRAFEAWPIAFTFFERSGSTMRVQLLTAHMDDEALVIDTVRPEGKKEMVYADFLRSGARPVSKK